MPFHNPLTWVLNGEAATASDPGTPTVPEGNANRCHLELLENTLDNQSRIAVNETDISNNASAITALQANGAIIRVVADIAARDAVTDVKEGNKFHVLDDGDGKWAEYIADGDLNPGAGSFVKTADQDTPFSAAADWTLIINKPATFPPDSHTHDASDITSGTLPVARGGTGSSSQNANRVVTTDGSGNIVSSSITSAELGHLSGVSANIQTQLTQKAPIDHTHNASTDITSGTLATARGGTGTSGQTANRAVQTDGSGNIVSSSITSTELGHLSGVTSNIQSQIDAAGGGGVAIFKASGTFNKPAGVTKLEILLVGGGAGGGKGITPGSNGGSTSIALPGGTRTAKGGVGGFLTYPDGGSSDSGLDGEAGYLGIPVRIDASHPDFGQGGSGGGNVGGANGPIGSGHPDYDGDDAPAQGYGGGGAGGFFLAQINYGNGGDGAGPNALLGGSGSIATSQSGAGGAGRFGGGGSGSGNSGNITGAGGGGIGAGGGSEKYGGTHTGGGGAGEAHFFEETVTSGAASYSVTIGAGGDGGANSAGGISGGGGGGQGICIIRYN